MLNGSTYTESRNIIFGVFTYFIYENINSHIWFCMVIVFFTKENAAMIW